MASESAFKWLSESTAVLHSQQRFRISCSENEALQQSGDRGIISSLSNSRLSVQRPVPTFHSLPLSPSIQLASFSLTARQNNSSSQSQQLQIVSMIHFAVSVLQSKKDLHEVPERAVMYGRAVMGAAFRGHKNLSNTKKPLSNKGRTGCEGKRDPHSECGFALETETGSVGNTKGKKTFRKLGEQAPETDRAEEIRISCSCKA